MDTEHPAYKALLGSGADVASSRIGMLNSLMQIIKTPEGRNALSWATDDPYKVETTIKEIDQLINDGFDVLEQVYGPLRPR